MGESRQHRPPLVRASRCSSFELAVASLAFGETVLRHGHQTRQGMVIACKFNFFLAAEPPGSAGLGSPGRPWPSQESDSRSESVLRSAMRRLTMQEVTEPQQPSPASESSTLQVRPRLHPTAAEPAGSSESGRIIMSRGISPTSGCVPIPAGSVGPTPAQSPRAVIAAVRLGSHSDRRSPVRTQSEARLGGSPGPRPWRTVQVGELNTFTRTCRDGLTRDPVITWETRGMTRVKVSQIFLSTAEVITRRLQAQPAWGGKSL